MNPVSHFEISVDDVAAAKEFYEQVFGWDINTMELPGGETYTSVTTTPVDENMMPTAPGAINGGLVKRTDDIKSPVITIKVDSIEDTIKKVEAAGGQDVGEKGIILGMGEYAYLKDTQGNVIGLWHDLPPQS